MPEAKVMSWNIEHMCDWFAGTVRDRKRHVLGAVPASEVKDQLCIEERVVFQSGKGDARYRRRIGTAGTHHAGSDTARELYPSDHRPVTVTVRW